MLFLFVASALIVGGTSVTIQLNASQKALCDSCGYLVGPTCCSYYVCDAFLNIATLKVCPEPLVWNQEELICDWDYNVRPECQNDAACYAAGEFINTTCPDALVNSLDPTKQCCQNLVVYTKIGSNTYQVDGEPIEECAAGQIFTLDGCYCEYPWGAPRTLPTLYWPFSNGFVEVHQNVYTDSGSAALNNLTGKRDDYVSFTGGEAPIHLPAFVNGALGSKVTLIFFGRFYDSGPWVWSDDWALYGRRRGIGSRRKRQLGLGGIQPLGGGGEEDEEFDFSDLDGSIVATKDDDDSLRTLAGGSPRWKLYGVTWCDGVRTVYINNRIIGSFTSFSNVDVQLGKSGLNFGGQGFEADMDEILIAPWCFEHSEIKQFWSDGTIPQQPIPEIYQGAQGK
ncbi:unnamed protein product [Owenia fusiformis]|uniref:Uncharacterized protein n=1 Tax=Owenia fusiformis TaxID=6347 RepID=A0A8J1UW68_OWEFU|nr:unnamed protein product [Owenia fusiformis]